MRKVTLILTGVALIAGVVTISFAKEYYWMKRPMMGGAAATDDPNMMPMCPVCPIIMRSMMSSSMFATEDGGVVVMTCGKLMKYDKKLNLVNETEVKMDLEAMQQRMIKMMKNCPMCKSMVMGGMMDVVETAMSAGNFNSLVNALKAADLVNTLKGEGPFTIFAPTDEAFARLPAGTLEDLLKPENREKLAKILTYHVVPEKLMAAVLMKMTTAKTVNGQPLKIAAMEDHIMVDEAKISKADIKCSNGVIHVIDEVLMPE